MIYINFVVLHTLMLHAKFQRNWPSGSREENIFKVLSIFEHGGHLGHVTWIIYINFRSPFPRRLHIKFGFDWSSGFRVEEVWKCERTTDDDAGPWVYYKLTLWAWRLRWAKNNRRTYKFFQVWLHNNFSQGKILGLLCVKWATSQENWLYGFLTRLNTNWNVLPKKIVESGLIFGCKK